MASMQQIHTVVTDIFYSLYITTTVILHIYRGEKDSFSFHSPKSITSVLRLTL